MDSPEKLQISFQITYTREYCGGARPDEEILKEFATEIPYANDIVYLVSADGIKHRLQTDETGKSFIEIPPGNYKMYFPEKIEAELAGKDPRCKTWASAPDFELSINSAQKLAPVKIMRTCNPCLPKRF
jgi:hypothetical protein